MHFSVSPQNRNDALIMRDYALVIRDSVIADILKYIAALLAREKEETLRNPHSNHPPSVLTECCIQFEAGNTSIPCPDV